MATAITSSSTQYLTFNETGSLTDSSGNIWTISGGVVNENSIAAGNSANVTELAIVNGTVWQENASGLWWNWNGTDWGNGSGTTVDPTIIASASTATRSFQVSNGRISGPDGYAFVARGINIMEGNQPSVSAVQSDFPGINYVRLAMYDYADPSSLASYVDSFTSQGIVVELEDHTNSNSSNAGGSSGSIFSGVELSNELNWYSAVAAAFKDNPYVWFGTDNEPSETDSSGSNNPAALSDWQLQTYNAVRNAGNTSPVLLEANSWGVDGTNIGYNAADYAGMSNAVWDVHYYGWLSGYSTDQSTVSQTLSGIATAAQQITSADGTMPVIIGEYGNSTTGMSIDANGDQVITAVQQSGYGNAAWAWSDGNPGDGLTANGETTLSSYGQQIAADISTASAAEAASRPALTASASAAGATSTAASTVSASASGSSIPSDSVTVTTGSGTTTTTTSTSGAVDGITFSLMRNGVVQATVGANTTSLSFVGDTSLDLLGGAGTTTITATGGQNTFTAGTGSLDVTGGTGADSYVFTAKSGALTVEDFGAAKGDTLTIGGSLRSAMHQGNDSAGGILLSFGGGAQIDLRNVSVAPDIRWV